MQNKTNTTLRKRKFLVVKSIYTIYDSKGETYTEPMFHDNDAVAIRWASGVVNNPEHPLARFPEDFTMFLLGEYDPNTATFDIRETPKSVLRFTEIAQPTPMKTEG